MDVDSLAVWVENNFTLVVGSVILFGVLIILLAATSNRKASKAKSTLDASEPRVAGRAVSGFMVLERYGDVVKPVRARLEGKTLVTKSGRTYVIPEDYRPLIFMRPGMVRDRIYLAFLADAKSSTLIEWNGSIESKKLDPELLYNIMNTRILEKLAAVTRVKVADLLFGFLGGLGLAFILILVVFPLIGVPVNIGEQQVIVQPHVQVVQPNAPPPGNFTVQP